MKKIAIVLIAVLTALLCPHVLASDAVYEENFDKLALGPVPAGYATLGDGSITIMDSKNAGYYAAIEDKSDTATYGLSQKFPAQIGRFTMRFDYRHSSKSKAVGMVYISDPATSFPPGPAIFLSTNVSAFDGTTQKTTGVKLAADAWHVIVLDIDQAAGTTTMYIDGALSFERYAFRNPLAKSLSTFTITGSTKPSPALFDVDNIAIYPGAPKEQDLEKGAMQAPNPIATQDAPKDAAQILPSYQKIEKSITGKLAGAVALMIEWPCALVDNQVRYIDMNNVAIVPQVIEDRTLVPVRFIAESFGATVSYEDSSQTVGIKLGNVDITLQIGANIMNISGKPKTIDVPARVLQDRTFLPLRALVEAMGKEVLWDEKGLIVIGGKESVLLNAEEISFICQKLVYAGEPSSIGPYSAVYLSSRWYAEKANQRGNDLSTLNVLKQFMVTGDKWSYITDAKQISNIVNLGVSFQGGLNITLGKKDAKGLPPGPALSFEGKPIEFPWMTWGSNLGCVSNEAAYEVIKNILHSSIDGGASEFHHDNAALNLNFIKYSTGCFCDACMAGFPKYVKDTLPSSEYAKYQIQDIEHFSFQEYLKTVYQIKTDSELIAKRASIPLYAVYTAYQRKITDDYYAKIKKEMRDYGGKVMPLSGNDASVIMQHIDIESQALQGNFDYGQTEHKEDVFSLANVVSGGRIFSSIKKPILISPVTSLKRADLVRPAIAYTYALGHHMLVPWDIYLSGTEPRYFGTVQEYGDMYSFIRENHFLFDHYEIPAKIGVLANWKDITNTTASAYRSVVMKLFTAGIPYEAVMASHDADMPSYSVSREQLSNLSLLIAYSDPNTLPQQDRDAITQSGVKVVSKEDFEDLMESQAKAVATSSQNKPLCTVVRQNGPNTVVHVINTKGGETIKDIALSVSKEFVTPGSEAWLYRPGKNPLRLVYENKEQELKVQIDTMDEWSIVSFTPSVKAQRGIYQLPANVGGFSLGSPMAWGLAKEVDGKMNITSEGMGIGVYAPGDSGSEDQASFVYEHVSADVLSDYALTASLSAFDGEKVQGGIMLRESLSANSPFVGLRFALGKGLVADERAKYDDNVITTPLGIATLPKYMKLEKSGLEIKAYVSDDGVNWGNVLYTSHVLPQKVLAGVFAAGGSLTADAFAISPLPSSMKKADILTMTASVDTVRILPKYSQKIGLFAQVQGIKYEIDPSHISFRVADPTIATVDKEGLLTAQKVGKTTLTLACPFLDGVLEQTVAVACMSEMIIFEENFDGYAPGTAKLKEAWSLTAALEGMKTAEIVKNGEGNALLIKTTSANSMNATAKLPTVSGDCSVEFDFRADFDADAKTAGARLIYIGGMSICLFAHPGKFSWHDGKQMVFAAPHENGKWFRMKIDISVPNNTINWYIDGKLVAENASFRNPASSLSDMSFGTTTNASGTSVFYDNIKVASK